MKVSKVLDARGLSCPMPIVKTKMAIDQLEAGQILEIHATDRGAKKDLAAWAKSSGNELLKSSDEDNLLKFWVKKG